MIAPAIATSPKLFADYSYIRTWADCALKGYYAYRKNLVPREPKIYLTAGTALHSGFFDLHFNGWNLESATEKLREAWGDTRPPTTGDWSFMSIGHLELVLAAYKKDWEGSDLAPMRLKMSDLNVDRLAHHELKVDENGFVAFAETPLAIHMDDYIHAGKVDYPTQVGNTFYVLDWKTTSGNVTDWWAKKHANSHQLRGYTLMLEALTGIKFAGAYIMGVHTGKTAADEDAKWKTRKSSRSKKFGPYTFSPGHLKETQEWMRRWLTMIEFFDKEGIYPDAGLGSEICKNCDFNSICATTPIARHGEIINNFREREMSGILASGADSDDN